MTSWLIEISVNENLNVLHVFAVSVMHTLIFLIFCCLLCFVDFFSLELLVTESSQFKTGVLCLQFWMKGIKFFEEIKFICYWICKWFRLKSSKQCTFIAVVFENIAWLVQLLTKVEFCVWHSMPVYDKMTTSRAYRLFHVYRMYCFEPLSNSINFRSFLN